MVSQGRCAHRNGAQGSQGLFYGLFWGHNIASSLRSPQQNAMGRKGCSGGMVSQVRCAHRYEEMGCRGHASECKRSQGLGGGMVSQGRCAHRYEEMECRGHASECARIARAVRGGWYRKVAALTAMVRKDRKGCSGGWYRKVAALTAMVRKDRKGWAGGIVSQVRWSLGAGCFAGFDSAVFSASLVFLASPFLLFWRLC